MTSLSCLQFRLLWHTIAKMLSHPSVKSFCLTVEMLWTIEAKWWKIGGQMMDKVSVCHNCLSSLESRHGMNMPTEPAQKQGCGRSRPICVVGFQKSCPFLHVCSQLSRKAFIFYYCVVQICSSEHKGWVLVTPAAIVGKKMLCLLGDERW